MEYEIDAAAAPPVGVPVGTIVAFVGALNTLPPEWQPCDGRVIRDPASPFNNRNLPDLMNDRFIMGVNAAKAVGQSGGDNSIPRVGNHSHGGGTDHGTHVNWNPGSEFRIGGEVFDHVHGIRTDDQGAHDHGGDNRPAYIGVYFIVRIK